MAFFFEDKPLSENAFSWSITASSNDVADAAVPWPEGMLPGAVNNAARAMMAGIARFIADTNGTIATGGTAGSYTITSNSGHTALTNGILVAAKASATNTAGATLNFNTLGAKSIRVFNAGAEAALAAGQIIINGTYQFRYDTAANSAAGGWVLLNPSPDTSLAIQIGQIIVWTTDTLPSGYLWCNGVAASRTTDAALFAIIGETYGAGDGTTTFGIPDMCGRAPFGTDDMGAITPKGRITVAGSGITATGINAVGGVESVTLTVNQIPGHTHTGTTNSGGVNHTHTGTTASGGVDHTHAQATPSNQTGQFSGPGSNGWGGIYPSNSTATGNASAFAHTHTFTSDPASAFAHTHAFTSDGIGGGLLHSNMPPTITLNFIIKR